MSIFSFIMVMGLVLLIYILNSYEESASEKTMGNTFICGTTSNYTEPASDGKKVFNTNCAACHKLDKHMTGPALKSVIKKTRFY